MAYDEHACYYINSNYYSSIHFKNLNNRLFPEQGINFICRYKPVEATHLNIMLVICMQLVKLTH